MVVGADGVRNDVLCRSHERGVRSFLLEASRDEPRPPSEKLERVTVFGAVAVRVKAGVSGSVVTDVTSSDLPYIMDLKEHEGGLMALAKAVSSDAGRLLKGVVIDGMSFDFHIDKPGERLSYTAEFDEEGLPDGLDVFRTRNSEGETREYVIGLE
jgi:hypothetical protein